MESKEEKPASQRKGALGKDGQARSGPEPGKKPQVKVILSMIVKDEEHCIGDCLKNVKGCIDAAVIVDTGSSDKTKSIIKEWGTANGIPCLVVDDPWDNNFGRSRSLALAEAVKYAQSLEPNFLKHKALGPLFPGEYKKFIKAKHTYYALFMDADNRLHKNDDKEGYVLNKESLGGDMINVKMRQGPARYDYVWMVKLDPYGRKRWRWYEPLHEYVAADRGWTASKQELSDGYIISGRFGARSKNPHKYLDDAHLFRKALKHDPFNDRYMYYMGQSYRDAGEFKDALSAFKKRGEMPGFEGERYVSLVEAAKLSKIVYPDKPERFIFLLLKAINCNPKRLEAPYHLCFYYRTNSLFKLGYMTGLPFVDTPYPASELFLVDDIYKWKFYDEVSICAYYAGDRTLCKRLSLKALEFKDIPYHDRIRVENNSRF